MGTFDRSYMEGFASEKQEGYPGATTPVTDKEQKSGGEGNVAVTDQGQQNEVEEAAAVVPPKEYAADWSSGISLVDAAKGSDKTGLELIQDRERWSRETGGAPLDIFDFYTLASGRDLTMSAADAEKAEKKRRRQERWEQIGNVLSHLGNFVGAIAGAPSAHTQLESGVDLTKRQQALRDKTDMLRRQTNSDILSMYYKQKADERAMEVAKQSAAYQQEQMRQGEKKLELAEKREDRMEAQMWLNEKFRDRKMTFEEAKQSALQAYRNGQLSLGAARIAIAQLNAGGYTVEKSETKVNPVTGQPYTSTTSQTKTPMGNNVQTPAKKPLPGGKKKLPGQ